MKIGLAERVAGMLVERRGGEGDEDVGSEKVNADFKL